MAMVSKHIVDTYSLGPMQQGMLLSYLTHGALGVDLEQVIVTIPGQIDRMRFERAWEVLLDRHAVLRTSFSWHTAEEPIQHVWDSVEPELGWVDLRKLTPSEKEHRWQQILRDQSDQSFCLDKPPLWRAIAAQTDDDSLRIAITFHHIIMDARAVTVLIKELHALALGVTTPELLPAPTPFHAYIDWVNARDLTESKLFWSANLKGFTEATALPSDLRPRRSVGAQNHFHDEQYRALPEDLTAQLRALARKNRCTLNIIAMAAWALVLGRNTSRSDVVFGAIRSCRQIPVTGSGSIVGLFINVVPLRVSLPAGQSFRDWLLDLRARWVAIRPHEHTPLTAIQQWSEVPAGESLFQTLINYQEPLHDRDIGELEHLWHDHQFTDRIHPIYPITCDAEGGLSLSFRIRYDRQRFSETTIRRILSQLETVLQGVAEAPDQSIADLPFSTESDYNRVLVNWNATKSPIPERCVQEYVVEQAQRAPQALAVEDSNGQITYGELYDRASRLASDLQRMGVEAETCVAIFLPRSLELVIAQLAVMLSGGAFMPLDPAYPTERLKVLLDDGEARVIITTQHLAQSITWSEASVLVMDKCDDVNAHGCCSDVRLKSQKQSPDALAYLIHTSGSTGHPKGVEIEHRSLLNLVLWHQRTHGVTSADRASLIAGPAFDASIWELWPYLAAGASIHIPPEKTRSNPAELLEWLYEHRITIAFVPTPLAELMLDLPVSKDIALRAVLTGGDRLRHRPLRETPFAVINHYGPTEATVVATYHTVEPTCDGEDTNAPPIGKPIANTQVYVLDDSGRPTPIGVAGELFIGGSGLARGYRRRSDLTKLHFVTRQIPALSNAPAQEVRVYRTGDCVRWNNDGQLEFLGRFDDQVKIRGFRIEPAEIEQVLAMHPGVRECIVLSRNINDQQRLIAYINPAKEQTAPAFNELRHHAAQHLPNHMIPDAFVAIDNWPLSENGKIDRRNLPIPQIHETQNFEQIPAQTETEKLIAQVLEDVLGRSGISANESFFELGGHSLAAAQAVSKLRAASGKPVTLHLLFEHPTVAELANAMDRLERITPERVSSTKPQDSHDQSRSWPNKRTRTSVPALR